MKLDPKRTIFALSISLFAVAADASAQKSGKAQTSSLPIRHGYYAIAPDSCAFAVREGAGMYFVGRNFEYMDGVAEIVRTSRRSTGEYDLTERTEDEAGKYHNNRTKIRIISPSSFARTAMGYDGVKDRLQTDIYRFCSPKKPKDF